MDLPKLSIVFDYRPALSKVETLYVIEKMLAYYWGKITRYFVC